MNCEELEKMEWRTVEDEGVPTGECEDLLRSVKAALAAAGVVEP